MISIIIPIYNAEEWLERCIESVLNQSYTNFELILINDGSSDNSGDICQRYASLDPRIKYINQMNSGVGKTRNRGLKEARGEWICFIDADDEVTPYYLEAFQTDKTKADIVYSGIKIIDINAKKTLREIVYKNEFINSDEIRFRVKEFFLIGFPYGKAYKKKIFDEFPDILFPTDISFHEDHVFVLNYLFHVNRIHTVNDITYVYKIDYSKNSLSRKNYTFDELYTSSDQLFEYLLKLKHKFNLKDVELEGAFSFAFEPILSGLEYIYTTTVPYRQRKQIIKKGVKGKYNIKKYYFPTSKRGKIIKTIHNLFPILIADLFYRGLTFYRMHRR